MKKIFTVILAFIIAFLLNEIFVRFVIKYPVYGVEKKMIGIRADDQVQNIFKPYSNYWNVEGGNKVFTRNHLGLTGTNVIVSDSSKYIFILGSSFIEAGNVTPYKMATSVFAKKVKKINPYYEVINLGYSGHDAMDSYIRALYFSQMYKPVKVILVIDSDYPDWFKSNTFNPSSKPVFKEKSDIKTKLLIKIRNSLAFLNLAANSLKTQSADIQVVKPAKNSAKIDFEESYLSDAINAFHSTYSQKFICISISHDSIMNEFLKKHTRDNQIEFDLNEQITNTEFRIKGEGHLNEYGNILLGNFLYEKFIDESLE